MSIELVGLLLGVLFIALCYLHYRVSKLQKQITYSHALGQVSIGIIMQMLNEKGVITVEDIFKFSAGTSIRKPLPEAPKTDL